MNLAKNPSTWDYTKALILIVAAFTLPGLVAGWIMYH